MEEVPPDLIEEFRRLGLERPESWARSQVREGINQLSRARLLYWLFSNITRTDNDNDRSVADAVNRYDRDEAGQPGSGIVSNPQAQIYKRMLSEGFTERDIRVVIRETEIKALMNFVCALDGCVSPPPEAGSCGFGVFEIDEKGRPLRPVNALHESVHSFNTEARARMAAAPRPPKPDWMNKLEARRDQLRKLREEKEAKDESGPAAG